MKRLILNADDCNLTPGVTRGILECHDRGILTSTTLMVNLPLEDETVRKIRQRKNLGVGIHLNVTLGKPLSSANRIPSLLKNGIFRRPEDYQKKPPRPEEVFREYDSQIIFFKKRFGKLPDHLDTHHHLHDFPVFFQAFARAAKKWGLPVRRSLPFQKQDPRCRGLRTTDYLFSDLTARVVWDERPFRSLLNVLPEGISEIMCHPAYCDALLRQISSFQEGRVTELKFFSRKALRREVADGGIQLIRFSQI